VEPNWKFSHQGAVGTDFYAKTYLPLVRFGGHELGLNMKFKYTPNGKIMRYKTGEAPSAIQRIEGGLRPHSIRANLGKVRPGNIRDYLRPPEKVSLDAGLVVNKEIETGGSLELPFAKGMLKPGNWRPSFWKAQPKKPTLSAYVSGKDPTNVLADHAQFKVGKVNPRKVAGAVVKGTKESLKLPRDTPKDVGGRWHPLRKQVWDSLEHGEITAAAEKGLIKHGWFSGLVNGAAKSTLGDVGKVVEPPMPGGAFTHLAGFAGGTAAAFVGYSATDGLLGKHIGNPFFRKVIDGAGAGFTGIVTDAAIQKGLPALGKTATATRITSAWTAVRGAPVIGKAATGAESAVRGAPGMLAKAGSAAVRAVPNLLKSTGTALGGMGTAMRQVRLLSKAAPAVEKAGSLLGRAAPALEKFGLEEAVPMLGKVGRIGGPVGALLAGVPDGISAYKSFTHGHVGDGFKSVARGAIRVGFTAVGAAIGQAVCPIPVVGAVLGGVVGGAVGDFFAGLF
jgi:hypothetical protein